MIGVDDWNCVGPPGSDFYIIQTHLLLLLHLHGTCILLRHLSQPCIMRGHTKIPTERTKGFQGSSKWQHVVFLNATVFMNPKKHIPRF